MTIVAVMGVSGAGKSTVGPVLAERLGVEYAEADRYHPQANIRKMSSGVPLTDDDRWPWLDALADWVRAHDATGGVLGCSALKHSYRDVLRGGGKVWFLHLRVDHDVLAQRMRLRTDHFMPASLLDSQLADLEPLGPDEPGITVDAGEPTERIVASALDAFRELRA